MTERLRTRIRRLLKRRRTLRDARRAAGEVRVFNAAGRLVRVLDPKTRKPKRRR